MHTPCAAHSAQFTAPGGTESHGRTQREGESSLHMREQGLHAGSSSHFKLVHWETLADSSDSPRRAVTPGRVRWGPGTAAALMGWAPLPSKPCLLSRQRVKIRRIYTTQKVCGSEARCTPVWSQQSCLQGIFLCIRLNIKTITKTDPLTAWGLPRPQNVCTTQHSQHKQRGRPTHPQGKRSRTHCEKEKETKVGQCVHCDAMCEFF